MDRALPRISVVMPVYNGEQYLRRAIDSILAQTYADFEFVIVDDGSRDATLSILQEYAARDARFRIISRPNTGIVGALNDGLQAARGELIARMDADDAAYPERFAKQVAFLDAHPECVGVGTAFMMVDPEGDPIREVLWTASSEEIHRELLAGRGGMAHPTAMLRLAAVRQVGGYRRETQYAEDLDLWLRLTEHGKLSNLPEVLLDYRIHGGSICANRSAECLASIRRAVRDAEIRRGLPITHYEESAPAAPPDPSEMIAHSVFRLIGNALAGGQRRTARKHARRFLAAHPFSSMAWLLYFTTCDGPFFGFFSRIARRLHGLIALHRDGLLLRRIVQRITRMFAGAAPRVKSADTP